MRRPLRGLRSVRDLNATVDRADDRRIEVIANGLPLWNGAQLAVDTTLVSALTSAGRHRRVRERLDTQARRAKERTYPELVRSRRCRLVALALEVGGWSAAEAAGNCRKNLFPFSGCWPVAAPKCASGLCIGFRAALVGVAVLRCSATSLLALLLVLLDPMNTGAGLLQAVPVTIPF